MKCNWDETRKGKDKDNGEARQERQGGQRQRQVRNKTKDAGGFAKPLSRQSKKRSKSEEKNT